MVFEHLFNEFTTWFFNQTNFQNNHCTGKFSAHLWKSFHSCSYCESSLSATFFPKIFFSFFSAKVDFEFGAHLMFCLSGPVKVFLIFTLNDELCNIVHLNYYKLNFRSNGPKCRFGVSDYHFLPTLPRFSPGLRQGREACLPGLISFVTVSTPNFEFSEISKRLNGLYLEG